jgi:hypothetical protein
MARIVQQTTHIQTQPTQIKDPKNTIVICFDLDNTLVHAQIEDEVVYTGFSVERWRAFCQIVKDGFNKQGKQVIFGVVTNKFSGRFGGDEKWVAGLDGICQLDDIMMDVFDGERLESGLMGFLDEKFIYIAISLPKVDALEDIVNKHKIPKENIYLLDDKLQEVCNPVDEAGFNAILVPDEVYHVPCPKYDEDRDKHCRENACINFMYECFCNWGIDFAEYEKLCYKIDHKLHAVDSVSEVSDDEDCSDVASISAGSLGW